MTSEHIKNCMRGYDNGLQELALFWIRDAWISAIQKADVKEVVELTEWMQNRNLYVCGPFGEQTRRLK